MNQDVSLPLISIIIPTHNGRENLKECLHSIEKTKYPSYEVIVIIAASTDGTYEMLRDQFPHVRAYVEEDIGWGESLNQGIIRARGQQMILLSDDYSVEPNWLNELVTVSLSSDDIGIVNGKVFSYGSNDNVIFAGGKISIRESGAALGTGRKDCNEYNTLRETDFAPTPLVKREVFHCVGLLDPDYFYMYDDTDFCLRTKKAGLKIVYVPTSIIWHKGGGTTPAGSVRSYYYWHRNTIRFLIKNFPFHKLLLAIPFNTLTALFEAPRLILTNKPKKFQALLDAIIFWQLKHIRETISARSDPFFQSHKRLPKEQLILFMEKSADNKHTYNT